MFSPPSRGTRKPGRRVRASAASGQGKTRFHPGSGAKCTAPSTERCDEFGARKFGFDDFIAISPLLQRWLSPEHGELIVGSVTLVIYGCIFLWILALNLAIFRLNIDAERLLQNPQPEMIRTKMWLMRISRK